MKTAAFLTFVFLGLALPAFAFAASATTKSMGDTAMTPVRNLRG